MEKEYLNFFLRIDEKEYLTSFQKGHMYMKPARSFREYTGNVPGVGDKNEGLNKIITDKVTITFTDDKGISITPQICGPIKFYTNGYYPILCLYHLKIKCHKMDEKYVVELPKDYLKNLSENRKDPGVLILWADAFKNKIMQYINKSQLGYALGKIEYREIYPGESFEEDPCRAYFRKDPKWAYQNEWRLLLGNSEKAQLIDESPTSRPYEFEIGDLSGFSKIIDLSFFEKQITFTFNMKKE